jgi:hypothetical protein
MVFNFFAGNHWRDFYVVVCGKQGQLDARSAKRACFNGLHFRACKLARLDVALKRGIDNDQPTV